MTDAEGIYELSLILSGLKDFARVVQGVYPSGLDPSLIPTKPACWIHPTKWSTEEDDGDDPVRTRKVNFAVEITSAASAGPGARDNLANAVQRALHGAQFLDSTECRCESGDYHRYGGHGVNSQVTHALTVFGSFKYPAN